MQIGMHYQEYTNEKLPLDYREDSNGDYTIIDTESLKLLMQGLISQMRS